MKYIIPFALLAAAPLAMAQSSVQITGIIGTGVYSVGGAKAGASNFSGGHATLMAQDSKVPSRWVFRGTEDLGGGLSAIFLLDKGFNPPDGNETLGGAFRESLVGLASKQYGTLTLGRQFHPQFNVRDDYDPTADSSNIMSTAAFRMNNSVMYRTPNFGGFFAKAAYGFGQVANNTSASRQVGGYLAYEKGPVSTKIGFNNLKDALGQRSVTNALWGGSYDFGLVVAFAEYGFTHGSVTGGVYAPANNTDLLLGARVPFGSHSLAATWIRKDDKTLADADASQLQLLYTYRLSKRTALYAIATKIHNTNGANYSVSRAPSSPTAAQFAAGARPFTNEIGLGIRHSF
jgi:GBP family porin